MRNLSHSSLNIDEIQQYYLKIIFFKYIVLGKFSIIIRLGPPRVSLDCIILLFVF